MTSCKEEIELEERYFIFGMSQNIFRFFLQHIKFDDSTKYDEEMQYDMLVCVGFSSPTTVKLCAIHLKMGWNLKQVFNNISSEILPGILYAFHFYYRAILNILNVWKVRNTWILQLEIAWLPLIKIDNHKKKPFCIFKA